jgi:hypothetical protein
VAGRAYFFAGSVGQAIVTLLSCIDIAPFAGASVAVTVAVAAGALLSRRLNTEEAIAIRADVR